MPSVASRLSPQLKRRLLTTILESRHGDLREENLNRQGKGHFHVSGRGHEALAAIGVQVEVDRVVRVQEARAARGVADQGRAAKRLYGRTADMVKTFERLFGAYPWREYAQTVVSEFTWGGMENTGTTTLTEKALLDDWLGSEATPDHSDLPPQPRPGRG